MFHISSSLLPCKQILGYCNSIMTLHHLAYLQQVSDILESSCKPLAARLGFIAKKIASKHVIHIKGIDAPKLRRCKACQAPITVSDVKFNRKQIVASCSLCKFQKRYGQQARKRKNTIKRKEDGRNRKKNQKRRRRKKQREGDQKID